MILDREIDELYELLHDQLCFEGRTNFTNFIKATFTNGKLVLSPFHKQYYKVLDLFAHKVFYKLIITVPPQHGKTEGSTRKLPPYLLGLNKNRTIAICSYSGVIAQKFNRDIKRTITSDTYKKIFPDTKINERATVTAQGWKNTMDEFEVIDSHGKLKAVGVGGSLTSETVDVTIMDDLYKDWKEASSTAVSESTWNWYSTVAKTRGHNESQELMTFTRWSDQDIIGRLEEKKLVVNAEDYDCLEDAILAAGKKKYLKINFKAIKEGNPSWLDPRKSGEPLYPERHDLGKLEEIRELDPTKFNSLFQGEPVNKEGLMYQGFGTYTATPKFLTIKSYTDVADEGEDYLCSIVYGVPLDEADDHLYVLDVLYTVEGITITSVQLSEMLLLHDSRMNDVESNNGGKGFGRELERLLDNRVSVMMFYQGENKFGRIYTNSASVQRVILFPIGWETRWPEFSKSLTSFPKNGKAKHDDAEDCITGVFEKGQNNFYVD